MRLRLVFPILALVALLVGTVLLASPYAPVVGAFRPIEEIWALEDERTMSETPLVTALSNHGVPLAYDAQQNTFYCTLGLDQGSEWPDIHLTAPDASGITLCFTDDYTFDSCATAIREGYPYEIMAYTDETYAYFDIVFTGLPIVTLYAQEEITTEDTPATVRIFQQGDPLLEGPARVHLRGDGSLAWLAKRGYKVEFTRTTNGDKKTFSNVPGIGLTDDLVMLAMGFDETLMRDRLSWEMAALIWPEDEAFSARPVHYAELFVNDSYEGVYLLTTPYDIETEMEKASALAPVSDSLYRTAVPEMIKDRPIYENYELFHAPDMQNGFVDLQPYLELRNAQEDETFVQMAGERLDIRSLLRYELLVQAMALSDNINNNMYIWAHHGAKGLRYGFALWDMDLSWDEDPGLNMDYWFTDPVMDRVIALDVEGARAQLRDQWQTMREKGFTAETVEEKTAQYVHELTDSGAFVRDAQRWQKETQWPDAFPIVSCAQIRFDLLDRLTQALCSGAEDFSFSSFYVEGASHVAPMMDMVNALEAAQGMAQVQ